MEGIKFEQPKQGPELSYAPKRREIALMLPSGAGYRLYNVTLESDGDVGSFYGTTVSGEQVIIDITSTDFKEISRTDVYKVQVDGEVVYQIPKH